MVDQVTRNNELSLMTGFAASYSMHLFCVAAAIFEPLNEKVSSNRFAGWICQSRYYSSERRSDVGNEVCCKETKQRRDAFLTQQLCRP
jgi:hypothetical protein